MTEAKHSPLLPCPFCGSPARDDLLPHPSGPGWVQCSECECDQRMSDTVEEAVMRWNTRVTPSAPAQGENTNAQARPDGDMRLASTGDGRNSEAAVGLAPATATNSSEGPWIEFGVGWAKVHFRREVADLDRICLTNAITEINRPHFPAEIATEDELATELYAAEYDRDAYPFASQSSAEQLTYRAQARAILSKFDVWRRK
jgi:hypothetical protein